MRQNQSVEADIITEVKMTLPALFLVNLARVSRDSAVSGWSESNACSRMVRERSRIRSASAYLALQSEADGQLPD